MIKKNLLFILIFSALWGCRSEAPPEDLLSKEQMVAILLDIHVAEALIQQRRYRIADSAKASYQILERAIFEKHQIDTVRYRKSYEYYTQNLETFEQIYTMLEDSLVRREELIKADSLEVLMDTLVPIPEDTNAIKKNQGKSITPKQIQALETQRESNLKRSLERKNRKSVDSLRRRKSLPRTQQTPIP